MRLLLALFLAASFVAPVEAQIAGRVSDAETGAPIAGANVLISETEQGTTTANDGRYRLSTGGEAVTLVVSHVGYSTSHRVVKPRDSAAEDFRLAPLATVLDEIVVERVSMTGGLMKLRGLPGSAHLLTARALEQFEQTDIHRALRSVPGVSLQEEDGYGLRPNIGLRGTGSERSSKITVMEDGVLIAPAPYAAPSAYYFPTVGRMSGIEVVKGSSQIKYGPFTTGGAINLLSTPIPQKTTGKLTLLAGDNSNRLAHAYAGRSGERLSFLLETHQQKTDGFKRLDSGGPTGFEKSDYLGKVRWTSRPGARRTQSLLVKVAAVEEESAETYLGLTGADFEANPFRRYSGSQQDEMTTEQRHVVARHRLGWSPALEVVSTIYLTRFHRNWYKLDKVVASGNEVGIASLLANPLANSAHYATLTGLDPSGRLLVKANNRTYHTRGLESQVATQLGRHSMEVGLRIHYDEMDRFQWVDEYALDGVAMSLISDGTGGTDSNRLESASAVASFAQWQIHWGAMTLRPGWRMEHVIQKRQDYGKADPNRTGTSVSARRNVSLALLPGFGMTYEGSPYLTLFAGIHRGFAPPGTTEGADPESSINYEVGSRFWKGPFAWEIVAFVSDYSNLLGSDLAASGGTGSTDQFNGGAALVRGVEVSGAYNFGRLIGWSASLPFTVAGTFTRATFSDTFQSDFEPWGNVTAGHDIPYLPNTQVNATFGVEREKWEMTVSGYRVGEMRTRAGGDSVDDLIEGHLTFDVSVSADVGYGVKAFTVLRNATNKVYVAASRPAGRRPGMPRMLLAGLKASF